MSDSVIRVESLGKMYKVFHRKGDKLLDIFGLASKKKKHHEEFWALRGLDLEIKKGERVGFIGNNGAGKSTLLKLVVGNLSPTEGSIEVQGNIQALMELGTGFHPEFTGRENIRSNLSYQGVPAAKIKDMEDEIIEFSELEDFIDRPIRTYSAGMHARLAFSVATAVVPDILIVDEILGAGDAYFAGKSVERMRKLTEDSGATVLFVSHDLNSVLQLCDRVIWIDKGQVRMDGEPLPIIKEYTAAVRQREELRLKKQAMKAQSDAEERFTYRLRTEGQATIYSMGLRSGRDSLGELAVGSPMDNGKEQEHHLLTPVGQTGWGEPGSGPQGTFRTLAGAGEVSFANLYGLEAQQVGVVLQADLSAPLVLERIEEGRAVQLAIFQPQGLAEYEYKSEAVVEETALGEMERYSYGNRKVTIDSLEMLNEENRDVRIFDSGKPMKVVFHYKINDPVDELVFYFCIYLPDGRCASQWFTKPGQFGTQGFEGEGTMSFVVRELILGESSYVASAGIYGGLSGRDLEAESYHVIDRGIFFEIKQPVEITTAQGLCVQPYTAEIDIPV